MDTGPQKRGGRLILAVSGSQLEPIANLARALCLELVSARKNTLAYLALPNT